MIELVSELANKLDSTIRYYCLGEAMQLPDIVQEQLHCTCGSDYGVGGDEVGSL